MSHGIRTVTLLALVLAFTVLLDRAVAGRDIPVGPSKDDKKQPDWFLDPDGSLLIPGIGRVMVPPKYLHHLQPYLGGGIGGIGGGGGGGSMNLPPVGGGGMSPPSGGSYIPGGDDTLVPNPGVEVPNPSSGGTPAPSHP